MDSKSKTTINIDFRDESLNCPSGDFINPILIGPRDCFGLVNLDYETIPGIFVWWGENWTRGRVWFTKSYAVFLQDS